MLPPLEAGVRLALLLARLALVAEEPRPRGGDAGEGEEEAVAAGDDLPGEAAPSVDAAERPCSAAGHRPLTARETRSATVRGESIG